MSNNTEFANSIFEQPWWLDTVAQGKWKEVYAYDQENNVIGRLAFVQEGKRVCMPCLTQTIGPWIREAETMGNKHLSIQKDVVNELLGKLPKSSHILLCLDSSNKYILPYVWNDFQITPTFSYRFRDLHDVEKIYSNFAKIVKKNVKSANNKVQILEETNIDVLYRLLQKSFEVQGRKYPISKEQIENIIRACEVNHAGKMLTAVDKEGNVHACSYFVYDENVCYYLLAGADAQFRNSGAQSLILWKGIEFASNVSKCFDFEGSMVEGIENFMRPFGAELICNYEIRRLPLVHEIFNIMKRKIKRLMGYKV